MRKYLLIILVVIASGCESTGTIEKETYDIPGLWHTPTHNQFGRVFNVEIDLAHENQHISGNGVIRVVGTDGSPTAGDTLNVLTVIIDGEIKGDSMSLVIVGESGQYGEFQGKLHYDNWIGLEARGTIRGLDRLNEQLVLEKAYQ